jgi:hypothetical protein
MGEPRKFATPKARVTSRKAEVCSSLLCVKVPTMCGRTGTINPMEIMSISTAAMMKPMAGVRCVAGLIVVLKSETGRSGVAPLSLVSAHSLR